VAERVTASLQVPTIGIGAGPGCDGQILVIHDMLGLSFGLRSKFARRYADAGALVREAVGEFARQVRGGTFPSDAESYHLDAATRAAFAEMTTHSDQHRTT
jgi:3-methyl-2-oxobutanoate hydroxymethyltransferase